MGRRHRPFYRINAVEKREKRDGRVIEELGWYDPLVKDAGKAVKVNAERVLHWISQGAQPSESVLDLLVRHNVIEDEMLVARRNERIEHRMALQAKRAAAAAAAAPAEAAAE
jgi:small subunit ribosomal protein S16